jgi:ATP-binding cassette subfamily F protein 3
MDEPTNHLDIWASEALERSLQEFEGTVIVVSHDRYFLNRIAERLIVLGGPNPRIIEGNYDRYEEILAHETVPAPARTELRTAESASSRNPRAVRKRKFPYRKSADVEKDIARLEQELAAIETRLSDPTLYRDGEQVRAVRTQHGSLKARLAELYEHWEEAVELNG